MSKYKYRQSLNRNSIFNLPIVLNDKNLTKVKPYVSKQTTQKFINTKYNSSEKNFIYNNVRKYNIFKIPNIIEIDLNFFSLCNPNININDIFYGYIYHPKQLYNIDNSIKIVSYSNGIYIQKNNVFKRADVFVKENIYNLTFEYHIKNINLLYKKKNIDKDTFVDCYSCFLDNNKNSDLLIKKLIKFNKTEELIVFVIGNGFLNFNLQFIKKNFKNIIILKSNEYGNSIIPFIQSINYVLEHFPTIKYVYRFHTINKVPLIQLDYDYILSKNSKILNKESLKINSNCVGYSSSYRKILDDKFYNKNLINKYKFFLDVNKSYLLSSIYFLNIKVFKRVIDFIKNNNYQAYFLNNMYDINIINLYDYHINFLERIFGSIYLEQKKIPATLATTYDTQEPNNMLQVAGTEELLTENIHYTNVKINNSLEYKNNKLWAHLHCYDINKFDEIYSEYINTITKYFSVVVTFSIEGKLPNYNFTFLKIPNKGADIGAKFCYIHYLNSNSIQFTHSLFLHSKTNLIKRKQYFEILDDIDFYINKLKKNNNIGIYCIDKVLLRTKSWYRNEYHIKNIKQIINLPDFPFLFPEGNVYILQKDVANYIFDNRFNLYKDFNTSKTFDYPWFINYYKVNNYSYKQAYALFKNKKLYGNNFATGLGWRGLADGMFEHAFERIIFGVGKKLNKSILIKDYTDTKNNEINEYILYNKRIYRNPILLIACHTNSEIKIKSLIHNIKCFREYFDTIYIINSNEYKNVIEPFFENDKHFIFNNELTEEQAKNYSNIFSDITHLSGNLNETKLHYSNHGCKEYKRNCYFKKEFNYQNIYFQYADNTHLICHKKWYDCLDTLELDDNYFVLTNDSYLLANRIEPFCNFCENNRNNDMIGLLDSYEIKYHFPDFLRWYSSIGVKQWMSYYESNSNSCKTFCDMINNMEIGSTDITYNKCSYFKMKQNYRKNLHFDDHLNEIYINKLNYPVIKIKRLNILSYDTESVKLPDDFVSSVYIKLNSDLSHFNDEQAKTHFLKNGIYEGRLYKLSQNNFYPDFIKDKIKDIL